MSYIFEYTIKSGDTQTITILSRDEFSVLSDDEKIEYQSGPTIEEEEEELLSTLVVQGFIYDLINEVDLYFIPRALEDFIKENYRSKWEEVFPYEPSLVEREEIYWNFIDEKGDEALDGIDLHILNSIYKNDNLYSMIIKECEKRVKNK
tara:strand:- start:1650 stop:2096 length:447 start_codon:yes stop_codon:yes gene_type:complete